MRISAILVVVGCASPASPPPVSNTPPPKSPAPALAASDLNLDVRVSRMPEDGAVQVDYTIKNVSTHDVQVLGELTGTYWYRQRQAHVTHEGSGPIDLRLGGMEGCDACIIEPRGITGSGPL